MESLPTRTEEEIARRERKIAARVWNDRVKSVVAIMQGIVLILLGVGFFRFVLDPSSPNLEAFQGVIVFGAAVVLELVALYVLGLQRSEE